MVSGRGSNMAAFLELRSDLRPNLVVASSSAAEALPKARRAGVPCLILPKKIDWGDLDLELRRYHIDQIFLLGFMRLLPAAFVSRWAGRLTNLHPSLLPAYPGLKSIERAYIDRAAMGVTVHDVIAEVDSGRVIRQRRCLNPDEVSDYSLATAELLMHISEQQLVREVAWVPLQMP